MATFPSPTLQNLTVDGSADLATVSSAAATITGGSIDGTMIGATTPSSIKATTLNTSGAATLNSVSSANATFTGGSVDNVTVGGTTPAPVHATDLSASSTVSGAGFDVFTTVANLAGTTTGEGAYTVGYQNPATGSVARTVQTRLQDRISVKDFGAVGDGVTDDTTALSNCLTYCQANNKCMYVPAGSYLTDTINYGHPAGSTTNITITGDGSNCTSFVKKSADSTALFVAGTTAGYTGNGRIEGITFKGISGNTTACLDLTACDHWTFYDCLFTDALIGVNELGGVSNRYLACEWEYNNTGIYLDTAPSPSTSVSANNITFLGCIFGNSSDIGVHAETASQVSLLNCDLEANGLSGGMGSSAVYTGASIGSIGVHIKNCWIENNGTTAAVYFTSGNNTIEDTLFIANAAATYDLYVSGGTYTLKNVVCATSKTSNVYETSGVGTGNLWLNCTVPGKTVDLTKTSIITGTSIAMRGSGVPVAPGIINPSIQVGNATPTAGGAINVTFPVAFATAPFVVPGVRDNSSSAVDSVQISSVTTTGFHAQVTQYNGTSISTPNNSFDWIAIGAGS